MSRVSPWQQPQRSSRSQAVLAAHGLSATWSPSSPAWLRISPPCEWKAVQASWPDLLAGRQGTVNLAGRDSCKSQPGPLVKVDKGVWGRLFRGSWDSSKRKQNERKINSCGGSPGRKRCSGLDPARISSGKAGEMKARKEWQSLQAWDLSYGILILCGG